MADTIAGQVIYIYETVKIGKIRIYVIYILTERYPKIIPPETKKKNGLLSEH